MAYFLKYKDIIVSEFAGFGVVTVEMPSIPERNIISKTINGRDGDIYFYNKNTSREITLTFNVRTKNADDYIQTVDDLKNCFKNIEQSKLYIGTEDKYINAVVKTYDYSDVFISEKSFFGKGTISFYCADPYFYKGDLKIYDELSTEELDNEGDVETYPKIAIEFSEESTFLQVDSDNGSILLGNYPRVGLENTTSEKTIIEEKCESLSAWASTGNVVDEGATGDTLVINEAGRMFSPNITSTQDSGWHGACYRRNLPENTKNFEVTGYFLFYSDYWDVNGGSSSTTSNQYKIVANPTLNIRSGRGTSYKKLGSIPYGKTVTVTDISGGWGKVTYNGITGYIYMTYTQKVSISNYNYRTTANLNMRSGRSTKYKILITIPKGTSLNITDISGSWGKTTYGGKTGYVYMSYVTKLATSSAITIIGKDTSDKAEENTADSAKMGLLELYGFDSNNNKLFKCQLLDNNYYYKHTTPSMYIGSTRVLTDATSCPAPKTKTDEDGNKIKIDSGESGSAWNHFYGNFNIKRVDGTWRVKVNKRDAQNNITKTLMLDNLANSKYPTGDLAYIVIYMAGYGSYPIQNMAMNMLYVTNHTPETPEEYNEIIFEPGDIVNIDCENNTVIKNGENFMQHLDIGSTFFPLSPGKNDISVSTSCTSQVSAAISFVEKFN
jgi:predicted phage tail component-like protein